MAFRIGLTSAGFKQNLTNLYLSEKLKIIFFKGWLSFVKIPQRWVLKKNDSFMWNPPKKNTKRMFFPKTSKWKNHSFLMDLSNFSEKRIILLNLLEKEPYLNKVLFPPKRIILSNCSDYPDFWSTKIMMSRHFS